MYTVKHGLAPIYISKLFNAKKTQYILRNNDFELPKSKLFDMVDTIKYLGPLISGASTTVSF